MEYLNETFAGNPVRDWLIALGIAVGATAVLRLLLALAASRLGRLAEKSASNLDNIFVDALGRTRMPLLLLVGATAGAAFLELSPRAETVLRAVLVTVLLVQAGLWTTYAISAWLRDYRERQLEADRGAATMVGAIRFVTHLVIWTMVLLIALSNLGVDITALITGLGIGGIAVALALQNVLGDLLASLSIVFDKPFVIGDFIIVGDMLGVVEHVGLKTTRVRSLSGEQLVFANSDLLSSRVRNYGRMRERRVAFHVGVTYQTEQEHLEAIPGIIRAAIEEQDKTRFDRSNFQKFGDFALIFESVYYIDGPDYNLYMDIQERINLRIRERFLAEGIEFAYPTQKLFVQREEGGED